MSIKLIYHDISPTAKGESTITATEQNSFVDLEELKADNLVVKNYNTLEPNRLILDGNSENFPNSPVNMGYWSNNMSDENGNFSSTIQITRTFVNKHSAPGISFIFDYYDECYAKRLNVKWYRDSTLLYNKTFYPTESKCFCAQNVVAFNKVIATFYSTNKPHRYLKIYKIDDGIEREFYKDEITGLKVCEEISEIGESLSINTIDFDIKSKTDVEFMFQRTQKLTAYKDNKLLGAFFIDISNRNAYNQYSIEAIDYIGVLENQIFYGGIYNTITLPSLIATILIDIPYEIDSSLQNITLTGYIPVGTKREALQKIAFAVGCVIDCSRVDGISIRALSNTVVSNIGKDRVIMGVKEEVSKIVTEIQLLSHNYVKNSTYTEVFSEVLTGEITVLFSEPHHTFSITNGTIIKSDTNYAIISGTGSTTTLKARGYTDRSALLSLSNPLTTVTDTNNVISYQENTLITSVNSTTVLNRLATQCFRNKRLFATIKLVNEKVGDMVTIATDYGTKQGRIIGIELNPNTMYADVEILEA